MEIKFHGENIHKINLYFHIIVFFSAVPKGLEYIQTS